MRDNITLVLVMSLMVLFDGQALAADVDFSKAYVLPKIAIPTETNPLTEDESLTEDEKAPVEMPLPPVVRIGGVETTETHNDEVTVFNWILSLGFDSDKATFHVQEANLQNHFDPQLLQQQLHGTTWTGEYKTARSLYSTELRFISVQNGFIGAEIIHRTSEEPEPSSFLQAKVTGDITTQYQIDENGELVWVDVERYEEMVAKINESNEGKEGDDMAPIPTILEARHIIRLKRLRSINARHASSRWGSHSEYRLLLEKNKMAGGVGTPSESYSSSDALTGNGVIELSNSEEIDTEPPLPE